MTEYLRFTAVTLIGLILALVLGKQSKELGLLLTLGVCTLVSIGALAFLEPVTELLRELREMGELDGQAVIILIKCAGIAMLSELACILCTDAGEGAMGKTLSLLSSGAMLWLSLPLLRQLLELIGEVLA
jgi:hypothetical protein